MRISEIILLCALQTLGLMVILSHKKFRTPANLHLNVILFSMLIYYAFYYFTYSIADLKQYVPYFLCFAFISPPIIYFYCESIMTGKLAKFKSIAPHTILPLLLFLCVYVLDIYAYEILQKYVFIGMLLLLALLHILYPLLVISKLGKLYQLERFQIIGIFKYNKEKTLMIKLFVTMMLLHSVLLTGKAIVFCVTNEYWNFLEVINIVFFLILSYVIAYHVITSPNAIHHTKKKKTIVNFKQYSKSSLKEEDAKSIALRINKLFQEEKVYLDPEISLSATSKKLTIPSHHITETLNGLLGQSFNDFVNNYRVEEFKILLEDKKFRNYSILALAFEVGFKSKATFNASFKKFTKQTPSEYQKSLTIEK
ncbi:helix-turn-helix domain-containing protein [Labilibaculum antarcticum]|uniref:AraC family transcriptional regulator n=1 Tax=Labilibaculum antarcticum TaxID=1717717 RepID=A0A1Y1CSJ1_9BACT|nr:helix-turn-helix domain-containing protein [Labilibaculum antarcticum]BAX82201.1 AraC family transcriptional regulator [Labilibaculum antarcticum]